MACSDPRGMRHFRAFPTCKVLIFLANDVRVAPEWVNRLRPEFAVRQASFRSLRLTLLVSAMAVRSRQEILSGRCGSRKLMLLG